MNKNSCAGHLSPKEPEIFTDKSSLILEWLLISTQEDKSFSIREIARVLNVSLGLIHKVIKVLIFYGAVEVRGVNTAKAFYLLNRKALLSTWIKEYNVQKKCRVWSYNFGALERKKILKLLERPKYQDKFALALHSAAEALGFKGTNLDTLEIYLLDPVIRKDFEHDMQLCPQENSLKVLLIEPYYKLMIRKTLQSNKLPCSSPLLTFLDLYHFPLRGIEQAEYLVRHYKPLQKIYDKKVGSLW